MNSFSRLKQDAAENPGNRLKMESAPFSGRFSLRPTDARGRGERRWEGGVNGLRCAHRGPSETTRVTTGSSLKRSCIGAACGISFC